jgi:hypothetical protein
MKNLQRPKSSAPAQLSMSFDQKSVAQPDKLSKIVSLKDFKRKALIGYVLKNSKPF